MVIRAMSLSDAADVSRLSGQLGYPMPESTTESRIAKILSLISHAAFVAEVNSRVVGWIHVYVSDILEAENSYAEIGGLVVDEECRGQGIGKALVERCEGWTREQGMNDIRVRSAIKRTESHVFYQKLGFEVVKTQIRFAKKL